MEIVDFNEVNRNEIGEWTYKLHMPSWSLFGYSMFKTKTG